MHTLQLTIEPRSAFGGPIRGDTLFGQLCWAIRNRHGNQRLNELLDGYLDGKPFLVCSDAFPRGFLPRPDLPAHRFAPVADADRKAIKKRRWLPFDALSQPVAEWLDVCLTDDDILAAEPNDDHGAWTRERLQPHNSIDRQLGTTRSGDFAPYSMRQTWYARGMRLEVYLVFDPDRLRENELVEVLKDIGRTGYGRDASIGLGKYDVFGCESTDFPRTPAVNSCMTLAPCAPQGLGWDAVRSGYKIFTRFGRHGDMAVHTQGGPFKSPVLLADTGAIFGFDDIGVSRFIGQGLGGDGSLSKTLPETVQQAYAPIVKVQVEWGAP